MPKGPVQQIKWEDFRFVPGKPNMELSPLTSVLLKYDNDGHEIERIDEGSGRKAISTTVWKNGHIQSGEYRLVEAPNDSRSAPVRWNQWGYDSLGRVTEFRKGSGTLENHFVNYRYDPENRVMGWEYRQGAADQPFSRTEIKYTRNTVETTTYDNNGRKTGLQVQVLDERGRVSDLTVSDLTEAAQLKLWYHTRLKYDEKGRVIERQTDPYTPGSGDDYVPVPGTYKAQYDDTQSSIEQRVYDDGKLVFHALGKFDRDGALVSLRVLDASGRQQPGFDYVPNLKTGNMESRAGTVTWDVVYDDHGNWIERRRWLAPSDGSPRILTRSVHQTITYR